VGAIVGSAPIPAGHSRARHIALFSTNRPIPTTRKWSNAQQPVSQKKMDRIAFQIILGLCSATAVATGDLRKMVSNLWLGTDAQRIEFVQWVNDEQPCRGLSKPQIYELLVTRRMHRSGGGWSQSSRQKFWPQAKPWMVQVVGLIELRVG
jgi:hypothetical protein